MLPPSHFSREEVEHRPFSALAFGLITLLALNLFSAKAEAGFINITVSEAGGHVRLEYQGNLDLSGMAYLTQDSSDEHVIRVSFDSFNHDSPYTSIINLYNSRVRSYQSPFASSPGSYFSRPNFTSTPTATSYGGNAFYLATASVTSTANIRFAAADFTGDVWTGAGFMQWNNTTLAALGVDASPKTWVLTNGDIITMGIVAVPEPSSLMLWGIGTSTLALVRRRLSRSRG